jgi:DNA-directed RNA polymerase specialized sigma24 family protein
MCVHDLSHGELAGRLGVPLGTMKRAAGLAALPEAVN